MSAELSLFSVTWESNERIRGVLPRRVELLSGHRSGAEEQYGSGDEEERGRSSEHAAEATGGSTGWTDAQVNGRSGHHGTNGGRSSDTFIVHSAGRFSRKAVIPSRESGVRPV